MKDCRAADRRESRRYDLAVIGAGSAGFSAAIAAAEQGAEVVLIGHGTIGGTCVNTGCVPSKNLIRAAEALHQGTAAPRFAGLGGKLELEDWHATLRQKGELVARLRQAKYVDLLADYGAITYIEGPARLARDGVTVAATLIRAGKVIIATGASPTVPMIAGIDAVPYLTSTSALELERLPSSLLVLGGGYIGCELGQMFARMGTRVTIVDVAPILLAGEPEISQALAGYLRDEGITVRENVATRSICRTDGGVLLELTLDSKTEAVEAERVLVTTGRTPNTVGLGLAEAGVARLPNGGIKVDDRMRTTKRDVYAAGDVTGRDPFVYMAAYGAKVAATNALNGDSVRYDNTAMPAVVFTDPQVAGVGLTEAQARAAGHNVKTSLLPLDQVPRALAARDTRGLIKLVADARTDRLLGAYVLAPEGADSIQTAALAIKHGLTVADLAATIFPYLTTVEGLKLAAQAFSKDVAKLSCCAG
jgi:mercury(II) reductase